MCWEIRRYEGDLLLVFRRSGTIVQHYTIRNEDESLQMCVMKISYLRYVYNITLKFERFFKIFRIRFPKLKA